MPEIIYGAAYQGDPQAVCKSCIFLKLLLKPKSTILIVYLLSNKIFYGFKSLFKIPMRNR